MRTVIFLGCWVIADAIRGSATAAYNDSVTSFLALVLMVAMFMDAIDFVRERKA